MKITSFGGMALVCLVAAGPFVANGAFAGTSATTTTCSANYKADKAAGKVPAGQTWSQYLSTCAAGLNSGTTAAAAPVAPAAKVAAAAPAAKTVAAPAAVAVVTPAVTPAATAPVAKVAAKPVTPTVAAATGTAGATGTQTPGQLAEQDRERQCGAMWKTDKAAGKVTAGETWPQYWSQCNTKLKG